MSLAMGGSALGAAYVLGLLPAAGACEYAGLEAWSLVESSGLGGPVRAELPIADALPLDFALTGC
jgi:hypothetical protein